MEKINQLLKENNLTIDQLSDKTKGKIKEYQKILKTPRTFKGYFDADGNPKKTYTDKLQWLFDDITNEIADLKIELDEKDEAAKKIKAEEEAKLKAEQDEKDRLAKEESERIANEKQQPEPIIEPNPEPKKSSGGGWWNM